MPAFTRLRRIGLMERYHVTRTYLGLDSCIVGAARYTTQDGATINHENLFPALRTLIETQAPLGLRLAGNEATANVFWVRLPTVDLSRIVEFSGKRDLQEALEAQLARPFETQTNLPLWRVEVLADNTVIFAVHHAMGDGMSLAALHLNLFKALQYGTGNTHPSVTVPTTTVFLPTIEAATRVRPSLRRIAHDLYNLLAPTAWTKANSAWTGKRTPTIPPKLTTHVRLLLFAEPDVKAFIGQCRAHNATLTSTVYALTLCILSRMLANDPEGYKRISALTAISLRGVAGVGNDAICDYVSVEHTWPALNVDFSWNEAARFAAKLKGLKRKGTEAVGMLRFLLGNYVPYMRAQLGTKREAGFVLSNLGRFEAPHIEGRWTIGNTVFAQCEAVVGSAFHISIIGDPTGGLNIAFSWGQTSIDTPFVEAFIRSFEEAFLKLGDISLPFST
ncbi:hypothetical protein B0H11DRAFT_1929206 [Mycena galericulata]|nr:hypothetical protein B0H11DRAFT_1929206 [Mycena galericulata]